MRFANSLFSDLAPLLQDVDADADADTASDQVWVDLCKGDAAAIQICKAFLEIHVEKSKSMRVVLGPEEEVEEQAIKSSRSLNTFWKSLIAEADAKVLLPKRQNPNNHWMALKRPKNQPGSTDEGPVAHISHWIYHEGAQTMGLSTTPDYQTVEFTVTDIGLILKTLWLCADLIPFASPILRLIFHALVLLFSYGFRQGMIIGMKYEDVAVAIIRDDKGRRRLITTFTIWRNKLRANALEHKKDEKFHFTTTLLPYPLFCLTHIVAVIGIHFNAFEAGYQSVEDLLHKPNLENVDHVPLRWKQEFLKKEIFPMSYTAFWRTLRRVLLVAGFNMLARIYAFRVGALATYDGVLTQATRNFVASHTEDVFQNNYQSERVRVDLARTRFGACAGGEDNEPLFEVMRDLSMQNDSGAPLEATAEQKQSIESRRDVTARRTAFEEAKRHGDKEAIKKAKAALEQRRRTLYELLVMDAREKYFKEASRLRAEGQSTDDLRESSRPPNPKSDHASLDVASLMELWTGERGFGNRSGNSEPLIFDFEAESRSEMAMVWLLRYVQRAWTLLAVVSTVSSVFADIVNDKKEKNKPKATELETWTCLLCQKIYKMRSSLSRHFKEIHIDGGTFNHPFPCPKCPREDVDKPITKPIALCTPMEWVNHAELVHGKQCAPTLPKTSSSTKSTTPKAPRALPCQPRKTTSTAAKRKTEDPEVLVFDLSMEPPRKKRTKSQPSIQEESPRLESGTCGIDAAYDDLDFLDFSLPVVGIWNQGDDIGSINSLDDSDSYGGGFSQSLSDISTPMESPVTLPDSELLPDVLNIPLLATKDVYQDFGTGEGWDFMQAQQKPWINNLDTIAGEWQGFDYQTLIMT